MKKSLIFWFAAVTCAALFLVGCESPTNGDAGAAGAPGTTQLSANITAASLQKIVDAGGPILISGNVEIGAGYVDLKGANITVDATLSFASGGVILNARSANVVIGAGSITGANAVVIPPAGESVWDSVSGLTAALLVSVAEFVAATGTGNYAVESLSVNASGIGGTALATATGSKTVYVLGTLAIDATTAVDTDTAKLVALGETTAAGAGGVTFGANTEIGTLKATGALKITAVGAGGVEKLDLNGYAVTITADDNIGVITSGAAGAVLTLPSDGQIVPITVGGYDIAIGGTPASVTIAELATPGAGKLVLPAAAISFTATAGGGKIAYATAPASVTLSSTTGLTYVGDLSTGAGTISAGNLTVGGDAAFTGNVSLGGDLTVTGTATIGGTLTNTAAAVATFNDETEVTGMVTSGSGGLTIGGTGAVTLTAAPTITNGLTVTNTTGVTMPSVTGVASKSIDASAGKVIFGTADNSATIVKGTLTSGTSGTASAAANGVITLAYSSDAASLVLADEGSITFAGTGNLKVAASDSIVLSGGRFDNDGAVLTLTPGATAATATLTGTTLTKLTLGAGATIAIPGEATTGLVLQGVIVDLSTAGQITIVEYGVLKLGTGTAGINYVGGIITKYNDTGSVVVAGGKESGDIADANNVTAFNSKADYAAIITALSGAGVGIQGTITATSSANNTIDRNDTFAGASSPAINVTGVP